MGGSKISIRTSLLDDKANACNMLCCYADELKDGFFPWVEQVSPTFQLLRSRVIKQLSAWGQAVSLIVCAA